MAATDPNIRSAATDTVALLRKSDFMQVVPKARAIRAVIRETAKAMEHPVEDGTTITDHRIIQPVEVELSVILAGEDYRQTYQDLKTLFRTAELLIVQTATDSYQNMLITDMPHDETADMVGAVAVALKLREVKTVKAAYGTLPPRAVQRPIDSSTVKRGEVQTKEATPEQKKQAKNQAIIAGLADKAMGKK